MSTLTVNYDELVSDKSYRDARSEIMRLAAEAAARGELVSIKLNGETICLLDASGIFPRQPWWIQR